MIKKKQGEKKIIKKDAFQIPFSQFYVGQHALK